MWSVAGIASHAAPLLWDWDHWYPLLNSYCSMTECGTWIYDQAKAQAAGGHYQEAKLFKLYPYFPVTPCKWPYTPLYHTVKTSWSHDTATAMVIPVAIWHRNVYGRIPYTVWCSPLFVTFPQRREFMKSQSISSKKTWNSSRWCLLHPWTKSEDSILFVLCIDSVVHTLIT